MKDKKKKKKSKKPPQNLLLSSYQLKSLFTRAWHAHILSLKSAYACLETALLRYLSDFNKAIMLTALAELWKHYRPHLLLKGTDGACTANSRTH